MFAFICSFISTSKKVINVLVLYLSQVQIPVFSVTMSKHNKRARTEYERKRRQAQKLKKKKAKQEQINLQEANEKKIVNENISEGYSSSIKMSDTESQTTAESPFHNSSDQKSATSSNFSVRSSRSFSWERAQATDPLLVKWEEYKLLQTRIQKIKQHKF